MHDTLNKYRIVPRLMVAGYGFLMWDVAQWFMVLPEPNSQQASFVSVMVGASAAIFGLYTNSGPRND
jgi:hypothetical protein